MSEDHWRAAAAEWEKKFDEATDALEGERLMIDGELETYDQCVRRLALASRRFEPLRLIAHRVRGMLVNLPAHYHPDLREIRQQLLAELYKQEDPLEYE